MSYRSRITSLAAPGCLLAPATHRVLLLTGQSSFATSALSPAQLDFLEAVAPPGFVVVRTGFPFHAAFTPRPYVDEDLLSASWRNARQALWSLTRAAYVAAVAKRLQSACDNTAGRLVLVTGSCGLQLANAAWSHLHLPSRIQVIALGPACLSPLRMSATVIQGRRDIWSRLLYRGPVDHRCESGHLDYWQSPSARELVRSLLR